MIREEEIVIKAEIRSEIIEGIIFVILAGLWMALIWIGYLYLISFM